MKHIHSFESFLNESSDPDKRKALNYKPAVQITNNIKKQFPNEIDTLILLENNFVIYIEHIEIKKEYRNKGVLRKIFNLLFQYADKTNKIVSLYPDDQYGTDRYDLEIIYRKFGFEYNMDYKNDSRFGDEDMLRYPI